MVDKPIDALTGPLWTGSYANVTKKLDPAYENATLVAVLISSKEDHIIRKERL
jgi:hypothetical protein